MWNWPSLTSSSYNWQATLIFVKAILCSSVQFFSWLILAHLIGFPPWLKSHSLNVDFWGGYKAYREKYLLIRFQKWGEKRVLKLWLGISLILATDLTVTQLFWRLFVIFYAILLVRAVVICSWNGVSSIRNAQKIPNKFIRRIIQKLFQSTKSINA